MKNISEETLEQLRWRYPAGCRIVLDKMEDPYRRIPVGAQATVMGVDDTGSILPAWDCGGSLNLLFGVDAYHKIHTEEEAGVTLDWYGRHQADEDCFCPRCGHIMWGSKTEYPVSRRAAIRICDECAAAEQLEDTGVFERERLMRWCACVLPQAGGGEWRR